MSKIKNRGLDQYAKCEAFNGIGGERVKGLNKQQHQYRKISGYNESRNYTNRIVIIIIIIYPVYMRSMTSLESSSARCSVAIATPSGRAGLGSS